MLVFVAFLFVCICLPIQLLGYVTTCTQGAYGSFLTRAIYSSPLLLLNFLILTRKNARKNEFHLQMSLLAMGLLLALTMVLTRDIWFHTLVYGSPCGPDYRYSPPPALDKTIIMVGYLLLPVGNFVLCFWLLLQNTDYFRKKP